MRIAYVDGIFYSFVNGRVLRDIPAEAFKKIKPESKRKGKTAKDKAFSKYKKLKELVKTGKF